MKISQNFVAFSEYMNFTTVHMQVTPLPSPNKIQADFPSNSKKVNGVNALFCEFLQFFLIFQFLNFTGEVKI